MCYYGSSFPKGIKKDQGHFNLLSDLHTLVRDAQQNLFAGPGGKQDLVAHLAELIEKVKKGEYEEGEKNQRPAIDNQQTIVTTCTPTQSMSVE